MKDEKLETISNLFEGKEIRSVWNSEKEDYFFSVVDVIGALTDSPDPSHYWRTLKYRMIKEGNETVTNCDTFKFKSKDGKMRKAGGEVAKTARDDLEKKLGETVISKKNALNYQYVEQRVLNEIEDVKDDNQKHG